MARRLHTSIYYIYKYYTAYYIYLFRDRRRQSLTRAERARRGTQTRAASTTSKNDHKAREAAWDGAGLLPPAQNVLFRYFMYFALFRFQWKEYLQHSLMCVSVFAKSFRAAQIANSKNCTIKRHKCISWIRSEFIYKLIGGRCYPDEGRRRVVRGVNSQRHATRARHTRALQSTNPRIRSSCRL